MKTLEQLVDDWVKAHTRTALAKTLGCSGPTLSNKINGTSELTFSEAERLATALGISLEDVSRAVHAAEGAVI